jgi:hypothetical protein
MAETPSKTDGNLEQVADRIRELTERIIDSSQQAGEATLSAYAKTLENITELQGNLGKGGPIDWITTFATAQANFTRDLAEAYAAAARKLVS